MSLLASIAEQQYRTPELAGMPEGWPALLGLLLLVGLGYVVFWLYRREGRAGAPPRLRLTLGSLRVVVILLLAIVWLEPVIATYTIRTITASVVVLADVSASMGIADGDDAAPADAGRPAMARIARVAELLEADDCAWLKRLAARNDLRVYTFGRQAAPWPLPDGVAGIAPTQTGGSGPSAAVAQRAGAAGAHSDAIPPRLTATQDRTDLGAALAAVLSDVGESPVAGMVVISDGIFNQGMSVEDTAAQALRVRAPIHTVGVGAPREPRNVRITGIAAPPTAARGDPFEVQVEVAATGIQPTTVPLELVARPNDADRADERVLATRDVTLGGDQSAATLRLEVDPDAAGEFAYEARVAALPGEALEADNRQQTVVQVLDERLRVLLVTGRPSYEYRYVTRLLERDKTVDLSCWLQSAAAHAVRDGDIPISALPRTPDELFQYDALLLLDPDPRDLDSAWSIVVRRLVDEFGGGVLLQAGPLFTSRFLRDPRLEELINILPVVPDPDADVRLSEQGAFRTRDYPLLIPDDARPHPLLRLQDDPAANQATWSALPGVWWYLPVLREKPLATVLLRHGNAALRTRFGQPVLLAAQPFGAGRTVFMGFDSTWRWRPTGQRCFERFWTQLVRYLTQPRREGTSKRGTIIVDPQTIQPRDYIKIEARVLDPTFAPWHAADVECRIETPGGRARTLKLEAVPGRAGWFAARLTVDWTGSAVLRIPLPGADESTAGAARETALVKRLESRGSDIEMRALAMRDAPLQKLARLTGGEYLPLAEADGLPDRIQNATRVHTVRGGERALWDSGWLLAAIATLLAIEWFVRRRNHLL